MRYSPHAPGLSRHILWVGKYLAPPGHRIRTSAVAARCHNHHATNYCCVSNFTVDLIPLSESRNDPRHISLPSGYTTHSSLLHHALEFSRVILQNLDESTCLSFSSPWTSNSHPGSRLISPAHGLARRLFPDPLPLPKVAYTFCSSVHLRSDLAHTHAASSSIVPARPTISGPFTRQTGQYTCE